VKSHPKSVGGLILEYCDQKPPGHLTTANIIAKAIGKRPAAVATKLNRMRGDGYLEVVKVGVRGKFFYKLKEKDMGTIRKNNTEKVQEWLLDKRCADVFTLKELDMAFPRIKHGTLAGVVYRLTRKGQVRHVGKSGLEKLYSRTNKLSRRLMQEESEEVTLVPNEEPEYTEERSNAPELFGLISETPVDPSEIQISTPEGSTPFKEITALMKEWQQKLQEIDAIRDKIRIIVRDN